MLNHLKVNKLSHWLQRDGAVYQVPRSHCWGFVAVWIFIRPRGLSFHIQRCFTAKRNRRVPLACPSWVIDISRCFSFASRPKVDCDLSTLLLTWVTWHKPLPILQFARAFSKLETLHAFIHNVSTKGMEHSAAGNNPAAAQKRKPVRMIWLSREAACLKPS